MSTCVGVNVDHKIQFKSQFPAYLMTFCFFSNAINMITEISCSFYKIK